jgi:hypothetical protein
MQSRNAATNAQFKILYNRCYLPIVFNPQLCPSSCQHPQKITQLPFGRQKVKFHRVLKVLYLIVQLFREIGTLSVPFGVDKEWDVLVQDITQIWCSRKPLFNAICRKAYKLDACGMLDLVRTNRNSLHRHPKE